MMQLSILIPAVARADKRETMVIGFAAENNHAARHHVFRIDVGDFEGVEIGRPFEVRYLQDDVAELASMKIHPSRRRHAF